MRISNLSHKPLSNVLVLFIGILLSTGSIAETLEFRVIYSTVPGIDMILAGKLDDAIDVLENRQERAETRIPDELSTLCALYIVERQLKKAKVACQVAVDSDASNAAYNNRGVLSAHLGDLAGAIEDFDRARVRPDEMRTYLKSLGAGTAGNAELIASSNFEIATESVRKRKDDELRRLSLISGGDVEDLET